MPSKKENIKNFYKKKAYEKYEKERKDNFLTEKSHKRCKDIRYNSLYTNGVYSTTIERAFHNCHTREKNFTPLEI